jgi:hypothetical protein
MGATQNWNCGSHEKIVMIHSSINKCPRSSQRKSFRTFDSSGRQAGFDLVSSETYFDGLLGME